MLVVFSQNEILLEAAKEGQVDKVKEALNKNVDINAKDPDVGYSITVNDSLQKGQLINFTIITLFITI